MPHLYLFLDEGGNFDFSPTGTRHYTFTSVAMQRDFAIYQDLDHYKYDVIEFGKELCHFHCAEDNAHIKQRVFGIIQTHQTSFRIDNVVVRKCKTGTSLQEPSNFYSRMVGYLIKYVIGRYDLSTIDEVIVITDALPIKKQREAFQKAIKVTLAAMLPQGITYRVLHHPSSAHYGLQIADYCNWAIFKKWETGHRVHYDTVAPAIRSEFDIFRSNKTIRYYDDGNPL